MGILELDALFIIRYRIYTEYIFAAIWYWFVELSEWDWESFSTNYICTLNTPKSIDSLGINNERLGNFKTHKFVVVRGYAIHTCNIDPFNFMIMSNFYGYK